MPPSFKNPGSVTDVVTSFILFLGYQLQNREFLDSYFIGNVNMCFIMTHVSMPKV